MNELLTQPDRLHATPLGAERLRRNLGLGEADPVAWCREQLAAPGTIITRRGKNLYARGADWQITIHAGSLSIITAHRLTSRETGYIIRPLRQAELPLLEDLLYEAIFVPEGTPPPPRSILRRPELRLYIDGFGERRDDHALAAEAEGAVVGIAWARIMADYGHIDDETPSLAIAVRPEHRSRGIGTALLRELLSLLRQRGYRQASLSVQKANRTVSLYRRLGFRVAEERGEEYVMVVGL